ncbi:MAG: hypothetical protein K5647_09555 [Clostridiales bacterium]|nr:hypothetical protein [Clostridiales bacterium]
MALIEAESFVNTMGVNAILLSEFTDVRDACLWPVVAELEDDGIPASTDIQALYAKNGKVYSEYMGDNTVRASFLNSKLLEWTGFTAKDFKSYGDKDPVYLASADYYSAQFGGVIFSKATIVKVETDSRNGLYYIYYTPSEIMGNEWYIEYNSELSSASLMLLCADWIDGHFVIVSNQAIWSSYGSGNSAVIFKTRVENGLKAPGLRGLLRDDFQEDYFFNGNLPRVFSADIFAFVATYQGSGLDVEYDYPKVYAENGLSYFDDTGVTGVPGEVIRNDILRYTGVDIETFMNNPQVGRKPNYLATVDVYSAQFGGMEGGMPANVEVEWVDNVYHVTYVDAFDATHRNEAYLKLNWDGSYQIMANKIIKGMG